MFCFYLLLPIALFESLYNLIEPNIHNIQHIQDTEKQTKITWEVSIILHVVTLHKIVLKCKIVAKANNLTWCGGKLVFLLDITYT